MALSTVKTHARAICAKLDATSRTATVHKARLTVLIQLKRPRRPT